jgi:hypothetical protein
MTLVQRRSEAIKYDLTAIGDEFSWYEDARGLDLALLDNERALERKDLLDWARDYQANLTEEGQKQRDILERWDHRRQDTPNRVYKYEVNTLHWLRQKYRMCQDIIDSFGESVDRAEDYFRWTEGEVCDDPDDRPEFAWNQDHWNQVWKEWERILNWIALNLNKVSLSYCAWLYDHIETRLKCKGVITYAHWLKLSQLLICRLGVHEDHDHSTMWEDEMLRIAKLVQEFNSRPVVERKEEPVYFASYDDRFYGSMSINMEAALDQKWRIEALARANDMDVYAVSDLLDDESEELEENEYTELVDTLLANNMNKSATARELGISRSTVYRRLAKALDAQRLRA